MSWLGRSAVLGAAAAAVVVVLVVVGRWEAGHDASREVAGFRIVQRLVGPLDSPSLSGFRTFPSFDCLTYRRGANPFALELCFDHQGRVIEAIDRRHVDRRIWSLRFDPAASTDRVDPALVRRLLHKMGA